MRTLGGLLLIILGLWFGLAWGPTLWNDWNLSTQKLSEDKNASIVTACSRDIVGVANCIVINNDTRARAEHLDKDLKYLVFGLESGKKFTLMRGGHNKTYTTDVGVQYLTNRLITLAVFAGLPILFGLFGLLREGMRS